MPYLIKTTAWRNLQEHQRDIEGTHMGVWFAEDSQRFRRFSLESLGFLLDYSKNRITQKTIDLLCHLAQTRKLEDRIEQLFSGAIVNISENRPALHTALRHLQTDPIIVDGENIVLAVQATLATMNKIVTQIRQRHYLGFSGQPIDTIIHFGIGGSDLGPVMAFNALESYVDSKIAYHFISHQDADHVQQVLSTLNPSTTLLIIASKSFTTGETLANAEVAKAWVLAAAPNAEAAAVHFIAVTAKPERAIKFGISPEQVLHLWEWVGGRFSVWSAVGLIIAIAIGMEKFNEFLAGAHAMDLHFRNSDFKNNIPVILGLLDVWYNNFLSIPNRAVISYGRSLRYLPDHLQQVYMESLGKRVDELGKPAECETGFIVWGGSGSNSQHSFHQLLMQGNQPVAIDFILPLDNPALIAYCLAQSQVLMVGYTENQVQKELNQKQESGLPPGFVAQQVIPGNCPNNMLLFPKVTPYALGALLALYEHRVFVNSVIWGVNAFDQWGVERGKNLAKQISGELSTKFQNDHYDSSTAGLITWIQQQDRR